MKEKNEKLEKQVIPVIFRKEKRDGNIIAVFPTLIYSEDWRWDEVWCYSSSRGQHGMIMKGYYDFDTVPATKEEYDSLLKELVNVVGYNNLKIYKEWLYGGKGYKNASSTSKNVLPPDEQRIAEHLEGKKLSIMDWKTNAVLKVSEIDIFYVQDEGIPEEENYVICIDDEEYAIGGAYYDETIRLLNGGRIEIIRQSDNKTFRAEIAKSK